MDFNEITSRQNATIKNLVKLKEPKHRKKQGLFLIEGFREISYALNNQEDIVEVYFCPDFFVNPDSAALVQRLSHLHPTKLTREVFEKVSFRESPDGLLAVAKMQCADIRSIDLASGSSPLLLVAEHIEKPGNLGALIRSCEAAGVDALVLVDPICDLYNPNAIRSSQGLIFSLPIYVGTRDQFFDLISKSDIETLATTPAGNTSLWDCDLKGPTAIIVGSEKDGLSSDMLDRCKKKVRIPMVGQADSLNVNAAALVAVYEAVRQRNTSS